MLILHSLQVLHTKFIEDWLSSSWEEDVKGRRMKNYRNMLLRWQKNMYLIPRWGNSARVYVIGMLQLSIKQRLGIGEDYELYIYIYVFYVFDFYSFHYRLIKRFHDYKKDQIC